MPSHFYCSDFSQRVRAFFGVHAAQQLEERLWFFCDVRREHLWVCLPAQDGCVGQAGLKQVLRVRLALD